MFTLMTYEHPRCDMRPRHYLHTAINIGVVAYERFRLQAGTASTLVRQKA